MRKMKRFASVLVASAMVLAMAAPSFAVEGDGTPSESIPWTELTPAAPNTSVDGEGQAKTGTITIDNPQKVKGEGEEEKAATYTAYRIFDVTYSGRNYAYSIAKDSPWVQVIIGEGITGGLDDTEFTQDPSYNLEGITLTEAAAGDVYYVAVDDTFSAPNFAALLYEALADETFAASVNADGQEFSASGDGVEVAGLPLGYYFVTTNSGSLCNLTTTNPDVTIHDKNEQPVIEKRAVDDNGDPIEQPSVQIGDIVNYEITGKVPNLVGYEKYTYEVSDTMSDGLTLLTDPAITEEFTLTREDLVFDTHSFTLSLDLVSYEDEIAFGEPIVITYSALVNEAAADGVNPVTNSATLKYSNNPATNETGETPDPSVVELYTSNLVIDKYQTGDEDAKLAGASFVLQNAENLYYQYTPASDAPETGVHTDAKGNWVADRAAATVVTTDETGAASFTGLADGYYYLVETEAPTGYNLLAERVEVFVNGVAEAITTDEDGSTVATVGGYKLTTTEGVANSAGTLLPGTGGIGTTIFYAAGIILMAGAVFFVVRRKRA